MKEDIVKGPLSGKARRALRARGHHLEPVVQVGKEGVSPALLRALEVALFDHELVKIRLSENAPGDRHGIAAALSGRAGAELVQVLGRTVLLYRPRPDESDEADKADRPTRPDAAALPDLC